MEHIKTGDTVYYRSGRGQIQNGTVKDIRNNRIYVERRGCNFRSVVDIGTKEAFESEEAVIRDDKALLARYGFSAVTTEEAEMIIDALYRTKKLG